MTKYSIDLHKREMGNATPMRELEGTDMTETMSAGQSLSDWCGDAGDRKTSSPQRLLVIGCSQRKYSDNSLLPALKRYDGPLFQIIKKFQRSRDDFSNLDIYILSARFGLIPSCKLIPSYDQVMTLKRADELAPHTLPRLIDLFTEREYQDVHLSMGANYLRCIHGYEDVIPHIVNVAVSYGSMGKRQYLLKSWLYNGKAHEDSETGPELSSNPRAAVIRGVTIDLSADEVITIGRSALESKIGSPENFRTWYVDLDGKRIAPKWLVSQLTGLQVSSFHSGEARRLLNTLGIKVHSI